MSTAFATLCLCCQETSHAAENLAAWAHGADVILNTSATGANVAGSVNGFPVLVRLNPGNFVFSQAQGKGQDIRFSKVGGVPLAYEIERWDSARAVAEIWVHMDTVQGNVAKQTLRMLWGNPAASDSSKAGSVFRASDNFVATWHLNGTGTAARPNAVTGGNPAVPVAYKGNENAEGIIAGADSLNGGTPSGDYLDLGSGYAQFAGGFTYSVWAYPTAVKKWAHVLDLGNGEGHDNIIVNRVDTSNSLGFHNWTANVSHSKDVANQWVLNQWQYITVTMVGKNLIMYKDGVQIAAETLGDIITTINRTTNYIGRSNWAVDEYFQGKIDEPELAKVVRGPDWIKLAYQNQKAAQSLVTVQPADCPMKLAAPADTTVSEGQALSLSAVVECSDGFAWSIVSGPSQRILDPENKTLSVRIPRVAGDTVVIYRLTADFSDSSRIRDVHVTIKEAIPDPVFALPAIPVWNGRDSLAYLPAIANLAAIKASADPVLHWSWTFSGPDVDTALLADGVMLRKAQPDGPLNISLCLDNDATPVCHTAVLTIEASAAKILAPDAPKLPRAVNPGRDAIGRAAALSDRRAPARMPRFLKK